MAYVCWPSLAPHVDDEDRTGGHFEMAVDAVLHVQPCVGTAWVALAHDVDRVHVSCFVVEIVGLRVAKVEAALGVEMECGGDHVDALGLTVDSSALGAVVAVSGAGRYSDAVGLVSADRKRESVGNRWDIAAVGTGAARCAAGRRGRQVVVVG